MMKNTYFYFPLILLMAMTNCALASKRIDLAHQPASVVQRYMTNKAARTSFNSNQITINEISRETDANQILHVRVQQTYQGYPVLSSDAVIHSPESRKSDSLTPLILAQNKSVTMNGIFYDDLQADLNGAAANIFDATHASRALDHFMKAYQKPGNQLSHQQVQLVVYPENDKAHWAYLISFHVETSHKMPRIPTYVVDAATLKIYKHWDNIRRASVTAGGFGGNEKVGKISYDGLKKTAPSFTVDRDETRGICLLRNSNVTVLDMRNPLTDSSTDSQEATNFAIVQFPCLQPNPLHQNLYWNDGLDSHNGAFSPADDALVFAGVIADMYQSWYGIPVLQKNDKPQMLFMRVHDQSDDFSLNAYWDAALQVMTFGDGGVVKDDNDNYQFTFFPLISLDLTAHELSHGFTSQHARLEYTGQAAGLDESFSDMAAIAAEYYHYGEVNWSLGSDIIKEKNVALRYLDDPAKDCPTDKAGKHINNGNCSVDNLQDYINRYNYFDLYLIPDEEKMFKTMPGTSGKAIVLVGTGSTMKAFFFEDGVKITYEEIASLTVDLQPSDKELLLTDKAYKVQTNMTNANLILTIYQDLENKGVSGLSLDPHFSSGIFNRAFYLISTAPGWNPKKAFDVMVQANRYYWTSTTSFVDAACSVRKATQDLKYDQETVLRALLQVGIDTAHQC